jgi:hypothetical protein
MALGDRWAAAGPVGTFADADQTLAVLSADECQRAMVLCAGALTGQPRKRAGKLHKIEHGHSQVLCRQVPQL